MKLYLTWNVYSDSSFMPLLRKGTKKKKPKENHVGFWLSDLLFFTNHFRFHFVLRQLLEFADIPFYVQIAITGMCVAFFYFVVIMWCFWWRQQVLGGFQLFSK